MRSLSTVVGAMIQLAFLLEPLNLTDTMVSGLWLWWWYQYMNNQAHFQPICNRFYQCRWFNLKLFTLRDQIRLRHKVALATLVVYMKVDVMTYLYHFYFNQIDQLDSR